MKISKYLRNFFKDTGMAGRTKGNGAHPQADPPRPEDHSMPPLMESRKDVYAYYRMQFLSDGYPGKLTENGLVPHPIYGTYVLHDYLFQYRQTRETRYLDAARKVADAALSRMSSIGDGKALAFLYTPAMALSSLPGSFFSGLTQARYVEVLSMLWKECADERYLAAAELCLESLHMPVEKGGVLRAVHGGAVVEEWPYMVMGDYTLNGWTTAILLIAGYAERTGSQAARDLVERNLVALRKLLPLYDMPDIANSRYRLSGKLSIRLVVTGTTAEFIRGDVRIPGEGEFPIGLDDTSRWHNFVRPDRKPNRMMMNINLNYVSFPAENSVEFDLHADRPGLVDVQLPKPDWSPAGENKEKTWISLRKIALERGSNRVSVSIPWDSAPYVASPTRFNKKIGGRQYNSYHFIHIKNLRGIYKYSKDAMFLDYSEKWESYTGRWPSMPLYARSKAVLARYRHDA